MSFQLLDAVAALEAPDGMVALSVDYCYMLACRPDREAALARLRRISAGSPPQGMILMGYEPAAFSPYMSEIPEAAQPLITKHWPGPLELCLNYDPARIPESIHQGQRYLRLMQPQSHLLQDLLSMISGGVLAVLPVGRCGDPPPHSALEAFNMFGDDVDSVLSEDGELIETGPPTMVSVTEDGRIHLLRSGRVVLD